MGNSNSAKFSALAPPPVMAQPQGKGIPTIDYFGIHARGIGLRFMLHYANQEFNDT